MKTNFTTTISPMCRFIGIKGNNLYKFVLLSVLSGILMLTMGLPAIGQTASADNVLYVKKGESGNGSAWDNALGELSVALSWAASWPAANPPLKIWVAKGIYYPTGATPSTNRNTGFQLRNNVEIYGGFSGNETADFNLSLRDFVANEVILSGDIDQNDEPFAPEIDYDDNPTTPAQTDHIKGDNSYNVVVASNTTNTAVLDGFTITGGLANNATGNSLTQTRAGAGIYNLNGRPILRHLDVRGNSALGHGGGIHNRGATATSTIEYVKIRSNVSGDYGGGFFTRDGNPSLKKVDILDNVAQRGGGVFSSDNGSPILEDIRVIGNRTTTQHGGGIQILTGAPSLTRVIVRDNIASQRGGGIYIQTSNPTLTDMVIGGNAAGTTGGGLENAGASPVLTNVVVSNNEATSGAYGIGNYAQGAVNSIPVLVNTIVWGNGSPAQNIFNQNNAQGINIDGAAISTHNLIEGTLGGNTNVAGDYAELTLTDIFEDTEGGNYRLKAGSPAVNVGSGAITSLVDLAGDPRVIGGAVDLGAYESSYQDILSVASIPNLIVGIGVAQSELMLPSGGANAVATLTGGGTASVSLDYNPINWVQPTGAAPYDPEAEGTYVFDIPLLPVNPALTPWFTNTAGRVARINVKVDPNYVPITIFTTWKGNPLPPTGLVLTYGDIGALVATHNNTENATLTISLESGEGVLDVANLAAMRAIGVGSARLKIDVSETENHAAVTSFVDVQVLPKGITIRADAISKLHGEPDPVLTYRVDLVEGDQLLSVFSGTLSREPGEAAGTYAINRNTLALINNNYVLLAPPYIGAEFTINKFGQHITFTVPVDISLSEGPILLEPSSDSGLPVMMTVDDETVARLSGQELVPIRTGNVIITATQEGDDIYAVAEPVVRVIRILDNNSGQLSIKPLKVHSAISPNGDGINDFLIIEGIERYPENSVTIFDRFGEIIAQIKRYNNMDRVYTGELAPEGTYFYKLDVIVDGKESRLQGFFYIKK